MSMSEEMNVIDSALNLALGELKNHGMEGDDAQIALLVRLSCLVPEEVFNVASLLREDAELVTAMNGPKSTVTASMSES